MKKLFIATIAIGMLVMANNTQANTQKFGSNIITPTDFVKKTDGTWAGKMEGKTYWYKLDKNAKLWWSADGKKWAEVKNQMWADKDGKWLKIGDSKLWWSADMGKTWSEVPEWKWQGPAGEWYKFDNNWMLWVNN